jgi:hypothetical protein
VPILGDNVSESDETFYVRLLSATNARIVDAEALCVIIDNDDPLPPPPPPPPAGPGQIVVTVIGDGYVTDTFGLIDTRIGDNVGTYGPNDFPFLIATGVFLEWIGTACFTESCPIVPSEFEDGLNVTAVFASSLTASAPADERVQADCGCSARVRTELDDVFSAAIAYWAAGLAPPELKQLAQLEVRFEDLPGALLASAASEVIVLDRDAAGHGWFVDPTPWDNEEFWLDEADQVLRALEDGQADGRIDLLTVLAHEIGHVLGLEHAEDEHDLLSATLPPGLRRLPPAMTG